MTRVSVCRLSSGLQPQVRRNFELTHDQITALAEAVPPGCEGLTLLPYLTGERTPNWPHASAAVLGGRPGAFLQPGLLYRAAMEGATFSLLAGTALLCRLR